MRRVVAVLLVAAAAVAGCSWTRNVPTQWELRAPVEGNQLLLAVRLPGTSACHPFTGVDVDEAADEVTVTARVRSSSDTDECPATDGVHELVVELDAPLGDRRLTGCRPRNAVDPVAADPGPNCGA